MICRCDQPYGAFAAKYYGCKAARPAPMAPIFSRSSTPARTTRAVGIGGEWDMRFFAEQNRAAVPFYRQCVKPGGVDREKYVVDIVG